MPKVIAYPLTKDDKGVHVKCPECDGMNAFTSITEIEDANHSTADCVHCKALLIIQEGMAYEFHKRMHSKDPRWPEDGAGTGYVEV